MSRWCLAWSLSTLALVAGPASAQPTPATPANVPPSTTPSAASPSGGPTGPRDIVITTSGKRSLTTDFVLGGLAGGAVIAGVLGVYWNLDARSAANNVSATSPTGLPWTPADQREYQRAHDSSVKAGVCYGIGGALVVGSVVGLILTVPRSETSVIHPRMARAVPTLVPTSGGVVAGGAWRF